MKENIILLSIDKYGEYYEILLWSKVQTVNKSYNLCGLLKPLSYVLIDPSQIGFHQLLKY